MVNDWESAFEACPPYGEGKGAYGPEDTALLTEMERTLEKLLPWLEAEGVYLLNGLNVSCSLAGCLRNRSSS